MAFRQLFIILTQLGTSGGDCKLVGTISARIVALFHEITHKTTTPLIQKIKTKSTRKTSFARVDTILISQSIPISTLIGCWCGTSLTHRIKH